MPSRISRTSAMPLDLLVDQAVFDLEQREIWQRDWVFATSVDAVADPGDFVAVTVGSQPIIVVRGDDYSIRAMANVCSHRGMSLAEGTGCRSRFACPYHGWTYDDRGALTSVPYTGPDDIDFDSHRLATYRCEVWHGLVFVSLESDIEPLADRLGVLEPYIGPMALARLHHDLNGVETGTWNANWKAVFANAIDPYRHFRVHPETVEPHSPTDANYYLAGSALGTVYGGESANRADHLVISFPPSFVAIVHPDAMLWMALTPVGVDSTVVRLGYASEQPIEGVSANLPGWDPGFLDEDRAIVERLQANARGHGGAGVLVPLERALGDFHEYLSWRLVGKDPSPATVAALPGERPDPEDLG